MNAPTRKCAHEACHCEISPDAKFCSKSCEQAAAASQTHSTVCHCGHAACSDHQADQ